MSLYLRPLVLPLTVFLHLTFAAIARRGDELSTVLRAGASTSTVTALTFITPSPGADPIPITSQSQVVTSYIPVMTVCPLIITQPAPVPFLPTATPNLSSRGTAASNAVISSGASLLRRQAVEDADGPYANASIPTSVLTACSVSYTLTTRTICHTTLSPLASPVIPITNCYQRITFSTDHGYTLVAPSASWKGNISVTAALTVQTLESYYVAPWQYVYTGVPADVVDKVVCSTSAGGKECTTTAEDWAPGTGWVKATNTISLTLGAPITGVRLLISTFLFHVSPLSANMRVKCKADIFSKPAEVIVHPSLPTFTVPDGETATMSLSTDFPVVTSHATTTIDRSPASISAAMASSLTEAEDSTTTSTLTSTRTKVLTIQLATGI